ncbi:DNA-processing protein DprA [Lacticaseibacillus kribbianus]|uniref:DNA-processing protein DprA n=1 Tax=Lacticaseibacillus kribbianus TaxID=2926292 RepID=UPI003084308B
MQVRELLVHWHLAMHTTAWASEQALWEAIEARGLGPEDDAHALAGVAALAPLQAKWADHAWRNQAATLYASGGVLTRLDAAYPPRLAEASQPPAVLFYQGDLGALHRLSVAIVGARQASRYTRQALAAIGRGLPAITVLSGLAAGADTFAHEYALSRGWPTVAVVANGLDQVYPAHNRALQATIAKTGLLLSEYPPGVAPAPFRFVARNRIIAGLAHGVLVTEAAAHSGSLITANYALQNNREVFALPNRVGEPLGDGTAALIQAGAKLVWTDADLLDELQFYP